MCIEAPRDAMTSILAAHDHVRQLFDHSWMHLFALDETGRMAWKYDGDLKWAPVGFGEERIEEKALELA